MWRGRWSAMVPPLGSLAVVLTGFVWGQYLQNVSGLSLGQLAFLAGGLLGLVGFFRKSAPDGPARGERFAAASLIVYVVIAGVLEPLAFVGDALDVLVSVAWLLPLIVGGVLLPVRGCWLAGLGCWSVLFSGTAALGYNVSHVQSGMGFLIRWLE